MPYASPQIQNLFGLRPEDVVDDATPLLARIHPDDVDRVNESIAESARTMTPWHLEYRVLHPTRGELWLEGSTNPRPHPDGGVIWYGFVYDITDRKQMTEALAAQAREFRTLAENSPDNIARYDVNCRTLYVNPALEKTLGRPASKILGAPPMEMEEAHIYEARKYQGKIAEVLETGKADEMDLVLPDRGEGVRYHNIRFVAEWGADGVITGVQTIGRDITERKRAEQEHLAHMRFLESMDQVNRAIQGTNDLEQMMSDVIDVVLSIFNCDRAFLLYPCDPEAASWFSPMERTRPEYPGVLELGMNEVPVNAEVAETFRILLGADGPVRFGPGNPYPLPVDADERFAIKSLLSMVLRPKMDKPWQFGIHQCSYARIWSPEDERLLQEIGRRLADALTSLLAHRHLQESEERYRLIAENTVDTISVFDLNLKPIYVSPSVFKLRGYTVKDAMTQSLDQILTPASLQTVYTVFAEQLALEASGTADPDRTVFLELEEYRKDGATIWVELAASSLRGNDLKPIGILTVTRDITERKQAEEQRKNHLRFLESMDKVNRAMQSANDLEWIMSDVLDVMLSVFECDRAFLMYPCDPETPSWSARAESTRPEFPGLLAQGIRDVSIDSEAIEIFRILLNADGPVTFGPGNSHPLPASALERFDLKSFMSMAFYPKVGKPWQFGIHQCSYARVWTSEDERLFHEIGRRLSDVLTVLLTYQHFQESEERLRQIASSLREVVWLRDVQTRQVLYVNPAFQGLTGRTCESFYENRDVMIDAIHPDDKEWVIKALDQRFESVPFDREHRIIHLDGSVRWVSSRIFPVRNEAGEVYRWASIMEDITERKHHELEREAIITVSTALRKATTRAEILTVILDQLLELFDAEGSLIALPNPETRDIIVEMGRGTVGERFTGVNIPQGKGISRWVIENKEPYLTNHAETDPLFYRPELLGGSTCVASVPLIAQEQAIGALWIVRHTDIPEQELRLLNAIADITANATHRVTLHEQTEQQLHRLIALHQIDLAISTNFDLNITLNVILGNVKDELKVDAVSILLLNPITYTLDYAAGIGFRTRKIEQSHVKLGSGCAGRAAQEQRTVSCLDIGQGRGIFVRSSLLADEEFVSHYATALMVKGQVKGVLEFFHRKPLQHEHTWLSYFETLAIQAAIAIENASLFENLQRSNMELTMAYDATIEGWSRALDLRDRETEGHTQRVTEMALELAEKMGMHDAEKLDLRRGALLHDIGKMGVPDAILLKSGELSDSEWEIMRQHPWYAYQMLSPIAYLKRALEIPYCHHEKWDGSGYPRGLRGDSIPLSARVFAVVDVFDALTSDRPYSKAWPLEKAYRYIQEQAGKYFDPQVVKVFLEGR
jgi:PAS domain S-box-containing protein/putative nucleotidyltransferase with HDIG domain